MAIISNDFLKDTVKPLIDFINNEISKELILLEDEQKISSTIQNIETVNGPVIHQNNGPITFNTINGISAADLNLLIEKLISSLSTITDADSKDIENVKDDLESLQEQVSSSAPKKTRMQKALNGIKKFFASVVSKATAAAVSDAVTSVDWAALIDKVELFIKGLM